MNEPLTLGKPSPAGSENASRTSLSAGQTGAVPAPGQTITFPDGPLSFPASLGGQRQNGGDRPAGSSAQQAASGQTGTNGQHYSTPPPGGVGGFGPYGFPWTPPPQKPFRKRRPILFWGGIIMLLLIAWGVVRSYVNDNPLGPKVAVVNVEGVIMDSAAVLEWIQSVHKDASVKAVVVRINSPGGAVAPSQEIHQAVQRLNLVKPVVVSMSSVAASGGYYVAVAGREIYANPSTLTASIGVKLEVPNVEKLMTTIGISSKTLTTGALKDAGSTMRDMTPEEEAYFRELITDMYEEFLDAVARGRKMTAAEIRPLADGRAMTGRQALKAGLIDRLGDLEDATRRAAELGGVPLKDLKVVAGPEKPGSLLRTLLGAFLELEAEYKARSESVRFMY